VDFRILGPLEVVDRGRVLTPGGPRQRTLLALLLTRPNEVVSADRLIDELWGARPPRNATNALQYHVSQLRKSLAPSEAIATQEPGYLIRVGPNELDLLRFERLVDEARAAPPGRATELLRAALDLWRGPALADLAHEAFAQADILRLEELRLGALEQRFEADLALGRHTDLVAELEALVREHPLRERLRGQLMRALYGSGRQADALAVYRETRSLLVDELGIEPSTALQDLEKAILRQDPALAPANAPNAGVSLPPTPPRRAIMALAGDERRLDDLLAIAEPLARQPSRELILARLLMDGSDLAAASAVLADHRGALAERGVASRVAVYTTPDAGADAVLLATEHDVELVLVDAPAALLAGEGLDDDLAAILARAPCDVAVLVGSGSAATGPVVTPFGGAEHDWSAIEVAAWLAGSLGTTLRLVGAKADPALGRRDASRLLARASLMVQQVVGVVTEPVLVAAGEAGVVEAARDARLLVIGLSERWRSEGLGGVRRAVAAAADVPTLFVRRGPRPGGLAPNETLTRFTWTLTAAAAPASRGK
jgi:DNA-binding SARP family transcriptional activator/CBS domain-containing protein